MRLRGLPPLVLLLAAFGVAGTVGGCSREARTVEGEGIGANGAVRLEGGTMGTRWLVALAPLLDIESAASLQRALEAELARIDASMSTWNPESTLARFNDSASVDFVLLDAALAKVLDTALEVGRASGGAYDVTLGEVFALYGFGPRAEAVRDPGTARDAETMRDAGTLRDVEASGAIASPDSIAAVEAPDFDSIDAARERGGDSSLVRLGDRLRKRDPGVRIELSSIAKGYAVDRLGEIVEAAGIIDYLVEIGGEVRTRGHRSDGSLWRVGLESPDGSAREGLALGDANVASSGHYRNWRYAEGRRLSHVIDGRDGRPVDNDLVAVTVLGPSTMEADAWATAMLVLGEAEAWRIALERGLEVQLTSRREPAVAAATGDGASSDPVDDRARRFASDGASGAASGAASDSANDPEGDPKFVVRRTPGFAALVIGE